MVGKDGRVFDLDPVGRPYLSLLEVVEHDAVDPLRQHSREVILPEWPGMIDHGTEVGNSNPAAALRAARIVVGGRSAEAFVKVYAPEIRPHEHASLASAGRFTTLIQINLMRCSGSTLASMARYDWLEIVGVGTLVFTAGVACWLLFGA